MCVEDSIWAGDFFPKEFSGTFFRNFFLGNLEIYIILKIKKNLEIFLRISVNFPELFYIQMGIVMIVVILLGILVVGGVIGLVVYLENKSKNTEQDAKDVAWLFS